MSGDFDQDILGTALLDFLENNASEDIIVHSDFESIDMYPVSRFFRSYNDLPDLEKKALRLCEGKILDVGAGAGVHSLILNAAGFEVTPIDISPGCVAVMRKLGLPEARKIDFFNIENVRYDTVLLLMNGLGLVGKRERLKPFFEKARKILFPGGQIVLDSTDIGYMYKEEDGSMREDHYRDYTGEVTYQMKYKGKYGPPFLWLYMNFDDLAEEAERCGFEAELIYRTSGDAYLAKFLLRE